MILIPQGGRYPHDAIEVVGLRVAPMGGGRVTEIRADQIHAFTLLLNPAHVSQIPMEAARFTMDEWGERGIGFSGYTTGQHWNGWAVPYFTLETGLLIVEAMKGDDCLNLTYDKDRDCFVEIDPNSKQPEPVFHKAELMVFPDGTLRKVYSIGGQSWCWYEVEEGAGAKEEERDPMDGLRDQLTASGVPFSDNGDFVEVNVVKDHDDILAGSWIIGEVNERWSADFYVDGETINSESLGVPRDGHPAAVVLAFINLLTRHGHRLPPKLKA